MVDIALIAGAVSALKGASDIASGLVGVRDHSVMQAKTIELQRLIVSALADAATAQSQQLELITEIRTLKDELKDRDAWTDVERRYKLKDFGENTFAYELVDQITDEPVHLACPNCFQKRQRSILQFEGTYFGRKKMSCASCDKAFDLGVHQPGSYL